MPNDNMLTDDQILSIAEKHHASHPGVDEWWEFRDRADVIAFARALLATPLPEPRAEVTDCGCSTNEACKMKTDGSCWRAD